MPVSHDHVEYWRLIRRGLWVVAASGITMILVAALGVLLKSDDTIRAATLMMPTFLLYSVYYALRYGVMPAGYGRVWYGVQARLAGSFIIVVYALVMVQLWGLTAE